MKYCPQCKKVYADDSLNFCLDDGQLLDDDEATAVLKQHELSSEAVTRQRLNPARADQEAPSQAGPPQRSSLKVAVLLIVVVAVLISALFLYYRFAGDHSRQIGSVAVMPFVNESGNPELDYLSDGIAESLIGSLSQIPGINVKSRSSVFRYKGKDIDANAVGADLGVQAILNGRVLKSGDNLRLSLELVDTKTDNVIWNAQYDRKQSDIISLQKEIARDVSDKLKLKLSGADQAKLAKTYTSDPEAYQLYLQGRFYWNKRTETGTKKALQLFQQAVEKDPKFALAYVGISDSYLLLGIPDSMSGVLPPHESVPKARAAADKALEVDDTLAEGYASRAHARWKEHDWAGAEADFRRSIELNDNYVYSHLFYAHYLSMLGRSDEAIAEMKRAAQIDPLSIPVVANLAFMYYSARRYKEAVEAAKKAIELDPESPLAHQRMGMSLELSGQLKEAIPEYQAAVDKSGRAQTAVASLARAAALTGDTAQAKQLLFELKSRAETQYVSSYNMALIFIALNDEKMALEELEAADSEGSVDLLLAKVDPRLDPIRKDPRFQQLLARVFPS